MIDFLDKIEEFAQDLSRSIYKQFKADRYGINCAIPIKALNSSLNKYRISNWLTSCKRDAVTETIIQFEGWLPIKVGPQVFDEVTSSLKIPTLPIVRVDYKFNDTQDANLMTISSDKCTTNIDVTPSINVVNNNGTLVEYTFVQSTPSATWVINHNLGLIPNVLITDLDGNEIGGIVRPSGLMSVVILFSQPVTGKAFLN